jgi:pyruvate/2-oxoglutarate dehydrogenase complex dihydrolipoamide acyltransferase (E2) component
MSVDVPAGTGFVMVRCVLRGKGKAWFDGLSLKEVAPPPAPPKSEAPPAAPKPPAAAPAAKPKTDLIELQAVLDSMKAASKANQDLLLQVESLQGEIQALREQLKSLQDAATQAPAATQPPPPSAAVSSEPAPAKRVPPLVPHEAGPEDVP